MRSDIEFTAAGDTVLRGWLFVPDATPAPGVVMAHGFSATKEMGLDRWAGALCDAGFAVLVYDHRNLGASDGEPRQLIDPWAQARDYRHAVTWLAARPEVDEARLAIWGSSYSGGIVQVVGAVDERVAAVVANVPWAAAPDRSGDLGDVRRRLDDGDADPDAGDVLGPLAVVAEPGVELPVFLPQEESSRWFLTEGRQPGARWENRVFLRSAIPFDPGIGLAHLAPTPLLMLVATDDRLAPTATTLDAYGAAGEPKELVVIEGDHFVDYDGEAFEQASTATIDFLRRML